MPGSAEESPTRLPHTRTAHGPPLRTGRVATGCYRDGDPQQCMGPATHRRSGTLACARHGAGITGYGPADPAPLGLSPGLCLPIPDGQKLGAFRGASPLQRGTCSPGR